MAQPRPRRSSMKNRFQLFTHFLIVVFMLTALPVHTLALTVTAQTNVGRISGAVTDTSGAVIPDALVKITNDATGVVRTSNTDDSGFYVVTNLLPGNYTVSVEKQGFKRSVQTGHSLVAD